MTFSLLILEQMKLIWAFTCFNPSVWSISKFDERCCFLYVHDNSDDFQIYFSTEEQCGRWGHTSRCVCVGVCVCLRLCSYSTCVRLYWNMTGWPRCVNNTVIMFVCGCVCVCVSGSAPWWKRWYLMGRGTLWSWRGRETEIHWRSAEVFTGNIYRTCSRWWWIIWGICVCVFVCVPVWVRHQRDRRQGGVGAGNVWSGVCWERPEQPGPNRHQRNPREGQQVGQSSPCFTLKKV